jgi:hypothetical protein
MARSTHSVICFAVSAALLSHLHHHHHVSGLDIAWQTGLEPTACSQLLSYCSYMLLVISST